MALHNHSIQYLCSVFGCPILPVAARLLPFNLNSSRPALQPDTLKTKHSTLMNLDPSTSTSTSEPLASSALSSPSTAHSSTTIGQPPPSQLPTSTSDHFTRSTSLIAIPSSSDTSMLTSHSSASSTSLSTISTTSIIPSSSLSFSTPGLEYSGVTSPNTDSNLTAITQLASPPPTPYQTQPSAGIPIPIQTSTPRTPSSLNVTHLGLIVGFSIFGVALLISLLAVLLKKRCACRRRRGEIRSPIPSSPTPGPIQFEIDEPATGERRHMIMSLQPDRIETANVGDTQAQEVRPRVKSPRLAAWKKGEVPEVCAPAQTSHGERVKSPRLEAWKKGVVPELETLGQTSHGERAKSPRLEAWKKGVVPELETPAQTDHNETLPPKEPELTPGRAM